MGAGYSQQLFPCFNPAVNRDDDDDGEPADAAFTASESLDETLGHSFCYVRSSARFVSPTHSDRFLSPSQSLRFDPVDPVQKEAGFRSISGASVSANTSTPRTVLQIDNINDNATDNSTCTSSNIQYASGFSTGVKGSIVNGFEGTSSFSALPLQPVPRGGGGGGGCSRQGSGQFEGALFMSGPIQRGALSGPLDSALGLDGSHNVPFSAPLGGMYVKKRRRKGISVIRKAFSGKFKETKRPWVVPERNFVAGRNDASGGAAASELDMSCESNAQWALGKAGEDRVHVVVSEEHGWLFVGIYDGFNGPDAPEFLMSNLYRTMYKELEGLFWDNSDQDSSTSNVATEVRNSGPSSSNPLVEESSKGSVKKVTFQSGEIEVRRRRLWEFLAEDSLEEGLDLSGSDRFAFSVDDAISVSNARSAMSKRSLLLSKLKQGFLGKHNKENKSSFFGLARKEKPEPEEVQEKTEPEEEQRSTKPCRRRKMGPVDPDHVLRAMSRALELTELAYLDMTDKVLDRYPELALMGSCLLVVLMRDEDVYVMNVGDSRAIVAQYQPEKVTLSLRTERNEEHSDSVSNTEGIVEETEKAIDIEGNKVTNEATKLTALQLSTDHSTSIDEEVVRIKNEHPDDSNCIANDRVKGRLKVTRAFGAGFLKKPKLNDALLEMFRNEYIGTAPYISCSPSLRHHKLCPKDQFLVLSSDGLYQYFTNQEVVSFVENFMEKYPDGDPAQHLIEELLVRAAKKAGMGFHELLDIPQGDRRKYHDDVTVMVISLEGRIWKSSGKYP